jgi:hypothetical protein
MVQRSRRHSADGPCGPHDASAQCPVKRATWRGDCADRHGNIRQHAPKIVRPSYLEEEWPPEERDDRWVGPTHSDTATCGARLGFFYQGLLRLARGFTSRCRETTTCLWPRRRPRRARGPEGREAAALLAGRYNSTVPAPSPCPGSLAPSRSGVPPRRQARGWRPCQRLAQRPEPERRSATRFLHPALSYLVPPRPRSCLAIASPSFRPRLASPRRTSPPCPASPCIALPRLASPCSAPPCLA